MGKFPEILEIFPGKFPGTFSAGKIGNFGKFSIMNEWMNEWNFIYQCKCKVQLLQGANNWTGGRSRTYTPLECAYGEQVPTANLIIDICTLYILVFQLDTGNYDNMI